MEVYNIPNQEFSDSFLIQGTQSNPYYSGHSGHFETMYDDTSPEFIFDQGMYYPTVRSYGYICTDSADSTEDPAMVYSLDGQDIHYSGGTNENLSVFYYTPNYGYEQSPYNPYNPYIPGAVIGMDGSYVVPQQYYTLPYENHASSAAYVPVVVQSRPDIAANGITGAFVHNVESANQVDGPADHSFLSSYPNSSQKISGDTATKRNSFARLLNGSRPIVESSEQYISGSNSGSFPSEVPSQIHRARGQQDTENGLSGNSSSTNTQLKNYISSTNGISGFESHGNAQLSVHKVRPKLHNGRVLDEAKVSSEVLGEQNRGPRMNKFKNQLVVKAYTKRAGNADANGNITIYTDQYNKDDFFVDAYKNAIFFVIKSYSEDDVHKSIKYKVWSSTPNGNKKLNSAYQDAQRISMGDSRGCPVFLFFSVNASGHFCGVAEMTGPVDFHKDMDFWHQDKWSGSFPVKWHIIKDLPNSNLRHIILENNENKSVTNSRDTQEICYAKGMEMLQIYNNYLLKTSLLDDFIYYENRQRILQEERARMLIKKCENPYTVPLADAPRKFNPIREIPFLGGRNVAMNDVGSMDVNEHTDLLNGEPKYTKNHAATTRQVYDGSQINNATSIVNSQAAANGMSKIDDLKISSLKINSKDPESNLEVPDLSATATDAIEIAVDVVTIGSMPVKVNGNELSDILTSGTSHLPRPLKHN